IRGIMLGMGHAMMGSASAKGEDAAVKAAKAAIESAFMESGGVRGAKGVLINITSSSQLGLHEVDEACSVIRAATENDDVQINFGIVLNESLEDEVRITVIATGFERESQAPPPPKPEWFEKTADPEPVPASAPEPEAPAMSAAAGPEPEDIPP